MGNKMRESDKIYIRVGRSGWRDLLVIEEVGSERNFLRKVM